MPSSILCSPSSFKLSSPLALLALLVLSLSAAASPLPSSLPSPHPPLESTSTAAQAKASGFLVLAPRGGASSLQLGDKCSTTAECTAGGYEVPAKSHYFCKKGACSWACNSGYVTSADQTACVAPVAVKRAATTTSPSSLAVPVPTCASSADCLVSSYLIPVNSRRACNNARKSCTFTCLSGYSLSADKSSCVKLASSSSAVPASTTTLQATPALPTCTASPDCAAATYAIPSNSRRSCNNARKTCAWTCNSGYTRSSGGTSCVKNASSSSSSAGSTTSTTRATPLASSGTLALTTATTTGVRPSTTVLAASPSTSASGSCSATSDCTQFIPANSHRLCYRGACTFRCNTDWVEQNDGCVRAALSSSAMSASASSTTAAPAATTSLAVATTSAEALVLSSSNSSAASAFVTASSTTTSPALPTLTTAPSPSSTTSSTSSSYSFRNTPTRTFSTAPTAPAANPILRRSYTGNDFFDQTKFWAFTAADPTAGSVNYQSLFSAATQNLTSLTSTGSARLGVDSTSVLAAGQYRNSVRISSVETVNPGSLVIADFAHVPEGCGTWPAFWLYSDPWPTNGEIDVLEGVSSRAYNEETIHTISGCSRNTAIPITGTWSGKTSSCATTDGSGCTVTDSDPASFGSGFNAAGGGVFAVQIAETGISIWRWKRANVPADVVVGSPRPQSWGTPVAAWDGSTCDTRTYFSELWITLNISICGRMAGKQATWQSASASGAQCYAKYPTCADAVRDPAAFAEAYFEVNSIQ
ncbi:hypothetical protein JCM8097_000720, partial [Rhodosporidiobolus ruineniae]